MKHLASINKYFVKYKTRFLLGVIFIIFSNYFRILAPQVSGYVVDKVIALLNAQPTSAQASIIHNGKKYDFLVNKMINLLDNGQYSFTQITVITGIVLLLLAILGGFFMFLMRQTIIVMSRHIEFDQKNEVYRHYQELDIAFFKQHSTGDLMNRISEDVSRVRMYTGPAVMYVINLSATIGFSLFFMLRQNWQLTLFVLSPLPILAFTIFKVNTLIHKKSEKIQAQLSNLTTTAQETYSGIRVIKSFVQETAMMQFFKHSSEEYKKNAISLAKVEAFYFPTIALLIGISTILTISIGGWYAATHQNGVTAGTIAEFVIYVNLLTFPVSAIGWTASMIQRAAASQKRLNEFLLIQPNIKNTNNPKQPPLNGDIEFKNVDFTYSDTHINAIKKANFTIIAGEKVMILGKTGSGKSTLVQLLLRFFEPQNGQICISNTPVNEIDIHYLRNNVSFVPQDVFLFSDTVANNIQFGVNEEAFNQELVEKAAKFASVHNEILGFEQQYQTVIGERGVTLSGGQKQRIAIARSVIKKPELVIFDDCLSAVDAKTEKQIVENLNTYLYDKTAIIITHRIFTTFQFDKIIVLENGKIAEMGTHEQLIQHNGLYAELYQIQLVDGNQAD